MSGNIFLNQMDSFEREEGSSSSQENVFLKQMEGMPEPPEGIGKSAARTALQVPLGYLKKQTWPADIAKAAAPKVIPKLPATSMFGVNPMGLATIKQKFPEADINIPEEVGEEIASYIPTQSSIEEFVEEKTGLPLTPKTELQKKARLAGEAAGFRRGGVKGKATAAVAAPTVAKGLQVAGVPEDVANLLGLLTSGAVPEAQFSKVTKPSGMTSRRFEKIKKPTKVTPGRHQKITEAVEGDVRKITEEILSKHPDYKAIQSDPLYKEKISEGFAKVRDLADQIPEKIKKRHLQSFIARRLRTHFRETKGITPSETEETFRKEFGEYLKKVSKGADEFSYGNAVDQFRKNNKELAEYFEPGKSKAFNTGKRDALLEYNRAIEELFETAHPDSAFTKAFKEQNKKWSQLSDVEDIESRLNKIFSEGKISFKDAAKLLDPSRENLRRPFKRMMGQKGFEQFESLMKDLTSIRNPYSMLKKAESAGFGSLAKMAAAYLAHPSVAKTYAGIKFLKDATKVLLDKPQLSITWKNALDSMKAGKYEKAEEQFSKLDSEVRRLSEKVKPLGTKGRVLPEGYAEDVGEKVTQTELQKRFSYYPQMQDIEHLNLKEKPSIYTEWDRGIFSGRPDIVGQEPPLKIFKNQWDRLLKKDSFNKYYSKSYVGDRDRIGKLGDFISNPKIRKMYEEVLETPIYREKGRSGSGYSTSGLNITVPANYSPSQFYSDLMHEAHHAMQDKLKPHLLRAPHYSFPSEGADKYLKSLAERKARAAGFYVKKDIIKMMKTSLKGKDEAGYQFWLRSKKDFPKSRPSE